MLTVQGLLVNKTPELKKKLTVQPECPLEDFKLAPFKVFRENASKMVIPQYFEECESDKRPEPKTIRVTFTGSLKKELKQDVAVNSFFDTKSGGVLCLDVGFGKTVCALAIAARLGLRTMILVHKEFLMNQWIDRIRTFCPGSTIGIVQQDRCEIENDFVITMIHTLSQKPFEPGKFSSIGLLIVDEAHHIGARVFSQSMFKLCPKWTLGLTATPDRKDKLGFILNWFLGPVYFEAHRDQTTDVRVQHVKLWYTNPIQIPVNRLGKMNLSELVTNLTEDVERNQVILDIVRAIEPTRNILILSDRRNHCMFLAHQLGASLYMGGMKQEELRESEKSRIIVATFSQAHEGLDIPKLDTILLTTPHSDVRQAIGRILRETPGKIHAPLIIDFVDQIEPLRYMSYRRNTLYKNFTYVPTTEATLTGFSTS